MKITKIILCDQMRPHLTTSPQNTRLGMSWSKAKGL